MDEPTQIAKCSHEPMDSTTVTVKHTKIVAKIYVKMTIFIKTTTELLNHDSFNIVLIQTMREVNKFRNLYSFEKKVS